MVINPICLNDSQIYSLYKYPQISGCLKDYPYICTVYEHSFQFKFTGILIINDIPVVVFPKNYNLPEDAKLTTRHAGILTRVLIRYRNEPVHSAEENMLLYGDLTNINARIVTAVRIMEDYRQYGYIYREYEIYSTTKKGHVDWSITINKTIPVVNHGRVLYDTPIIRGNITDDNNIICLLHRYVVSQCIQMWGWLSEMQASREMVCDALPCPIEEAIFRLQQELRSVYVQREINLIKMMIAYLKAQTGKERKFSKEILGTQYFSFVWEAICGYLFYNKYPVLNSLVPQPEWESDIVDGRISQRPDVFALYEKTLYILDAKYYNFHLNLPGWHDVVKQMFYRHTVILKLNTTKGKKLLPRETIVKNAFLFPGDSEEPLQYIGRVHVKDIDDLGEVKAFAINQREAMKTYAYRNDDIYRQHLMEELVLQCP